MSGSTCEREQELLAAVASAEVPDELRQHAAGCAECSEVLLVATFLRREAAATAQAALPDPAYLWWRALRDRRSAAAERATRLITIVQRAALLCAALLVVPLVRWGWPHLATGSAPCISARWPPSYRPAPAIPSSWSGSARPCSRCSPCSTSTGRGLGTNFGRLADTELQLIEDMGRTMCRKDARR
jgi:hypothetical protein